MMSKDRLYLESQYNLREQHPNHLVIKAEYKRRNEMIRKTLPIKCNLSCGANKNTIFDLISGVGKQSLQPAVIFIHGGFWRSGDKQECSFIANSFAQHGIATVLLNYSLAPDLSLKSIIREIRTSVINITAQALQLGLDPKRIILGGHSAGGHLAAMVESTNWDIFNIPKSPLYASFGISGLYNPQPLSQTSFQKILALPDDCNCLVARPLKATKQGLDLVACGSDETQELKMQSQRYADKVKNNLDYDPIFWVQQRNHYSVLLDLADNKSALFRRVLRIFDL